MPKPRKTLRIKLPPYLAPRLMWRKGLLRAVRAAKWARGITYDESDRLSLTIRLYLTGRNLDRIDVDNRLKDVMDALQGQIGWHGKKVMSPRNPIITNDRQVCRVTIEKIERPQDVAVRWSYREFLQFDLNEEVERSICAVKNGQIPTGGAGQFAFQSLRRSR